MYNLSIPFFFTGVPHPPHCLKTSTRIEACSTCRAHTDGYTGIVFIACRIAYACKRGDDGRRRCGQYEDHRVGGSGFGCVCVFRYGCERFRRCGCGHGHNSLRGCGVRGLYNECVDRSRVECGNRGSGGKSGNACQDHSEDGEPEQNFYFAMRHFLSYMHSDRIQDMPAIFLQ